MHELKQQIYGFDDFRLDVPNRQLLCDGRSVPLPSKAFDLLVALVENGGRLVSKEELLSRVWPDQIVEESNLSVQMSAIRKALGERKDRPRYIVTVAGHGYRFTGDVTVLDEEEDELEIEQHSFSLLTVEKENGTTGTEGAIEPAASPFLSGGCANVITVGTSVPSTGSIMRAASVLALQPVAPAVRRRAWLRVGVAAALSVVMLTAAFVLYRRLRHSPPAALFQQITLKRLTTSGNVTNARLSPDGKLYVYSTFEGEWRTLWLGHVDGGEPVQLRPPAKTRYVSLKFSPDGSSLYYTVSGETEGGALYKLPVFGGAPEKLREGVGSSFTFAPDGKRFAFVRSDGTSGKTALFIADTQGTAEREIAAPPTRLGFVWHNPSWSPDGETIAVGAPSNDNGTSYEVFLVGVADGSVKPLTAQNWSEIGATTWLHDGSGLIVVATDKDSLLPQLWQVSFPDGEARRLLTDLNIYNTTISSSSDDNTLLAVQKQTQSNVWVAPAEDLSRARQVTFGSLGRNDGWDGLDWTPEGKIIYTAVADRGKTIWTMDADGSHQKQMIPDGGMSTNPSVTDDGRYMVFQSNRSGHFAVWRANLDGSEMTQLTGDGIAAQPHIAPDGKWIVYISNPENPGGLWRVSVDGGEPLRLTEKKVSWPRVSPDGRFVAGSYDADGKKKLAIIPIEGGEPVKLFGVPRLAEFQFGIRWMPDGKAVTYRDWANGLWKQSLEGSEPERLGGLPQAKIYAYGWSRDGKYIAFTPGTEIRDVVIIHNIK
ncbi:MAG: winged helix-turn-helix domain-containing protein [Acidobacteria bacterium]|nr:winged helix-turn-helix domain-containing protein [Acidobacteriota bacterium]